MNTNTTNKKSISVSNLTLELYLNHVRPAAIKAGILEDAITEEGRPYHIADEATAKEIEDAMRCACFNAGYDGVERTHEEYIAHEAEQMLYQLDVSVKYCKDSKTVEALQALRDAMTAEIERAKIEKMVEAVAQKVEAHKTRSAWQRGVKAYALEMLEEMAFNAKHGYLDADAFSNRKTLREALLNGASDWSQYSWGGCALIYDGDIAERLCTPSELKKTHGGERKPNASEEWLDTQARALGQAAGLILDRSGVPSFRSWEVAQAARVGA